MDTPKTRRENEVWQACDDLWALNASLEALKGDQIRDQLLKLGYKKGSPNEIYKYRQTWRESRGISEKSLSQTAEVADPISRAVSLVYEQIQSEAQQKITLIQNESSTQLEKLTQQNQELILSCETFVQKHEALGAEHEGLKLAHETLNAALIQERSYTRELELKLEGCNLLLSELKSTYQIQIDKLEQKLKEQGLILSEELGAQKLETRTERDLRVKLEHELKRLKERPETHILKALKQESQKLTKVIRSIGRKRKTSKPLKSPKNTPMSE